MIETHERTTLNGKPYFGVWAGKYITWATGIDNLTEDEYKRVSRQLLHRNLDCYKHLEIRHEQYIYKTYKLSFMQSSSSALKWMVWGRAFEVMRVFNKHKKAKKIKQRVNGRWKWR